MVRIIILSIFMAFFQMAVGQGNSIFNRHSTSDGLNTNRVNCVWQDRKGFIWTGTENGLQRFDGRKFISFGSTGLENSLPPYGVDQILDAGDGRLWLRQGNRLGIFDPVTQGYEKIPVKSGKAIPVQAEMQLYGDSKGQVFLCIRGFGLMFYHSRENAFTERDLPLRVPSGWPVRSIFEDTLTGDYWISGEMGLAVYKSHSQNLWYSENNPEGIPFFDPEKFRSIYNFFIDREGTWWIFQWEPDSEDFGSRVIHYDPVHKVFLQTIQRDHNPEVEFKELNWIFQSRSGQVWLGGVNSLLTYDFNARSFIQHLKAIPQEFDIHCREIRSVFEDRENNIWLSTDNGLYRTKPGHIGVYNLVLSGDKAGTEIIFNAITETATQEKWIGTWGKGIIGIDPDNKLVDLDLYSDIPEEERNPYLQVWSMSGHSVSGWVWSGFANGRIAVFDPVKRKLLARPAPPVFEKAFVRQIAEDGQGGLLFGTQKGRIVKWDNQDVVRNEDFKLLRDFNAAIYRIYRDSKDRIWVGTHNDGAYILDPESGEILYHFQEESGKSNSLLGNTVYDVEQYNDSIFYASTGFINVINLNSGEVRALTPFNGAPGGNVTQMLLDDDRNLWFTHNNGLGSYNREKNIFSSYSERDGIIMGNRQSYVKSRMQNGEFWFGGENIIFGFDPEQFKNRSAPPDVTLTDFKLFDRYLPLDSLLASEAIRFSPEQNSISIYYSSLSYAQQDKLQYYYRLEGVDNDWKRAERELVASYTTLAAGDYTFDVKCENMQGVESASITQLRFTILPHFYQTWWFLSMVVLSLAALTYAFYRLRLKRLLAIERLRNKVARDLHDDIGSTLSTINILSSMAKTKLVNDPVKASDFISKISDSSQSMMESMDDIVWSIKPTNDSIQSILARMREYASSILEPKEIDLAFQIDGPIYDLKLNMEARRDIFLIFKEAVNNSAKYSGASQVRIDLYVESRKLIVRISDNGIGFNPQTVDAGNGLDNMRKRTESLQGNMRIISERGMGTEIRIAVPVRT